MGAADVADSVVCRVQVAEGPISDKGDLRGLISTLLLELCHQMEGCSDSWSKSQSAPG